MRKSKKIKPPKNEIVREKIQKLLKGLTLPDANWILGRVSDYITLNSVVK